MLGAASLAAAAGSQRCSELAILQRCGPATRGRAAQRELASACKDTSKPEGSARGLSLGDYPSEGWFLCVRLHPQRSRNSRSRQSVSQFECFKSLTTKEAALLPSETATAETAATFRIQIVEQERRKNAGTGSNSSSSHKRAANTNCDAYAREHTFKEA